MVKWEKLLSSIMKILNMLKVDDISWNFMIVDETAWQLVVKREREVNSTIIDYHQL